jgi:hypothetical protein
MFDDMRRHIGAPKPASPARLKAIARRLALQHDEAERGDYPEAEDLYCSLVIATVGLTFEDRCAVRRMLRTEGR